MRSVRLKFIFFCLSISFWTTPLTSPAQPGDPRGDPDKVPISGVEVLIGVGALVGVRKIRDLQKKAR